MSIATFAVLINFYSYIRLFLKENGMDITLLDLFHRIMTSFNLWDVVRGIVQISNQPCSIDVLQFPTQDDREIEYLFSVVL